MLQIIDSFKDGENFIIQATEDIGLMPNEHLEYTIGLDELEKFLDKQGILDIYEEVFESKEPTQYPVKMSVDSWIELMSDNPTIRKVAMNFYEKMKIIS